MPGFVKNLTINSLQLFINQCLTLLVFFMLAKNLDKPDFGMLNMILAILLTVFGILSFGIDQLLQKKMAEGDPAREWLPVALMHNFLSGTCFYLVLIVMCLFPLPFPSTILLLIAFGKLAYSLSMPYKQVMAGLEKFQIVFRMSVVSNAVKVIGLLILVKTGALTLVNIALVFLISDILEFLLSIYFFNREMPVSFARSGFVKRYKKLVKEALPQLGTVMFAAAMARFDWIFIGFFLSATALAEYSFAYRVFEIALFPMLVVAPLLVPRFTKAFRAELSPDSAYSFLFRMEMLVASFIFLLINILWEPLAGFISNGKYGAVNTSTIFILSLSMPLLYYNNFLWSLHFARGRTQFIFRVFAATFLVNVIANYIFIPIWGNEGAALAYLAAIFLQTIIYHMKEPQAVLNNWKIIFFTCISAMAGMMVFKLAGNSFAIPAALLTYAGLLVISGQVLISDGRNLREFKM